MRICTRTTGRSSVICWPGRGGPCTRTPRGNGGSRRTESVVLTSRPMRVQHIVVFVIVAMTLSLAAQDRGQRGGPAGPPMTLTVAGFPYGGQFPVKFRQAALSVAAGE